MPVCIAGMHRSGTSLIAHLLRLCGLNLGADSELLGPQADNPEGFWEHREFVAVNTDLLEYLGGTWEIPPLLEAGWHEAPDLAPFRERARALIQRFKDGEPWGWKDPRSSITFAFWKALIPELTLVECVRNPLEVASSLAHRDHFSLRFGVHLWLAYHRALEVFRGNVARVVTHYDSYFADPESEIARVLQHVGVAGSPEQIRTATSSIKGSVRRSRVNALIGAEIDPTMVPVQRFYLNLCHEAGPVYSKVMSGGDRKEELRDLTPMTNPYNEVVAALQPQGPMERLPWLLNKTQQLAMGHNQQQELFNAPAHQMLQRLDAVTIDNAKRIDQLKAELEQVRCLLVEKSRRG